MKTKLSYKIIALCVCAAMLLPLCSCGKQKELQKQVFAMDTVMILTAYGAYAEEGLEAASDMITTMDLKLDPDNSESYTYQINNAEGNDIVIPAQIARMLNVAKEVYNRTGGALDLSIYPIYLAWGGFKEGSARVPSYDETDELRKNLHFGDMELTQFTGEVNYSVRFPAGTQISFGATAKGFVSNLAVEAMRNAGVQSGIISLGGNVQTLGQKPDGSNWIVAVEDPNNTGSYLGTLSVGETAVVTSGNYQRCFTAEDGEVYHHILDPDTGRPVENGLLSVTIVCEDGTLADALSTAMFVLGKTAAIKYWRNYGGFDMVIVTDEGEVLCTNGLVEVFELTNDKDYTKQIIE